MLKRLLLLACVLAGLNGAAAEAQEIPTNDLIQLARIHASQQRYDQAMSLIQTVIRREPTNMPAFWAANQIAEAAGKQDALATFLEGLLDGGDDTRRMAMLEDLAQLYSRLGRTADFERTRARLASLSASSDEPRVRQRPFFLREITMLENGIMAVAEPLGLKPSGMSLRYLFLCGKPDKYAAMLGLAWIPIPVPTWHLVLLSDRQQAIVASWPDGEEPAFEEAKARAIPYLRDALAKAQ